MILTYQAVFGAMFSGLDRSIIGAVIVATRGNMPVRKRIPLVKYQLASSSLRSATSLQKKWKTCQRYETTPPSWRQAEKRIEYFPNKFLPNTKFGPATDGPGLLISLIPLVHPIKTVPTDERNWLQGYSAERWRHKSYAESTVSYWKIRLEDKLNVGCSLHAVATHGLRWSLACSSWPPVRLSAASLRV